MPIDEQDHEEPDEADEQAHDDADQPTGDEHADDERVDDQGGHAGADGRGLDELLDLLVFAPIGAFLHGPETVTDLAAKGRQDVANARFIGRAVLAQGRERMEQTATDVGERWIEVIVAAARAAGAPMADTDDTTPDEPQPPGTGGGHLTVVEDLDEAVTDDLTDAAPDVDSLAIPGYDSLAASQVVPRLDDLADDELVAVQEYERAHRGRMTILSRIAQLRAS